MIDVKKLMNMNKEAQLDIIKCKVAVARRALELAKNEAPEVQQVLSEYVAEAESVLEKASWSLR